LNFVLSFPLTLCTQSLPVIFPYPAYSRGFFFKTQPSPTKWKKETFLAPLDSFLLCSKSFIFLPLMLVSTRILPPPTNPLPPPPPPPLPPPPPYPPSIFSGILSLASLRTVGRTILLSVPLAEVCAFLFVSLTFRNSSKKRGVPIVESPFSPLGADDSCQRAVNLRFFFPRLLSLLFPICQKGQKTHAFSTRSPFP